MSIPNQDRRHAAGGRGKSGKRHEVNCRVCSHSGRIEIENQFCAWANTTQLAKDYGLSRDSIYRHVNAFNLRERRGRNLRAALERIIEKADEVQVNSAAVVAAVQAYAKINSQGAWVDRIEGVNLNSLFEKMTATELEVYARDGRLPEWFAGTISATADEGQEAEQDG